MATLPFRASYEFFNRITPIPVEEWIRLAVSMRKRRLRKGEHFLEVGDSAREIALVLKGLLRTYYRGKGGREFIKAFRKEGEVAAPYSELLDGESSRTCIEALEETEVLLIPFDGFRKSFALHPCWNSLGRTMAERHFQVKEQREYELLILSAADRLKEFLRSSPDLLRRVPQYQIASYLGISPVSLSRLMKKSRPRINLG